MSSVIIAGDTSGSITVSAPAVSGSSVLTLPAVTDTLVGKATTDTLTNKTLTSPTLTTPALGTPASGVLTNCTGVVAAALPTGSILQVVTTQKTDTFSTTSTSFVAITGISVAITPSSTSSRIAVFVDFGAASAQAATLTAAFRVMRASTAIGVGDAAGSRPRASFRNFSVSADHSVGASFSWVDSPSTVSSITYTVQAAAQSSATVYVNRSATDSDGTDAYQSRTASTITVMEIKG